jgi:MFS family permease
METYVMTERSTPDRTERRMRLPRALRPFRNVQYRWLTTALACSLCSVGIWLVASVWQVIALGGTASDLSLVAFGSSLGLTLSVLIGGVVADRVPQRKILLVVEAVRGLGFAVAAVLALSGAVQIWHLAVIGLVLGLADGFFYPAYSAWLPALVDADQLLAANGIEGMLRPTVMQGLGPVVASLVIAVWSPGAAFALVAILQVGTATALWVMKTTAVRRELDPDTHPLRSAITDVRAGFAYMVRTRWLLATLLFATVLVLIVIGPIEVLLPFAVKDQTGGGPGAFAVALASFGVGGAIGSLVAASIRLPRRYLTLMILAWGVGSLPLAVIGLTNLLGVIAAACFVVGFIHAAAQVVWGTLLQRRVPPALLGRVSSLDFFVSLALMPISMALAGPFGDAVGITPAFLIAGVGSAVLAIATLWIAKLGPDELAHPLDRLPEQADTPVPMTED